MKACVAYKYVALQEGGLCFCDNTYSTPSYPYMKIPNDQCGASGHGGKNKNAVYNNIHHVPPTPEPTPVPTPAPTLPLTPVSYVGCWTDEKKNDLVHGPKADGYTMEKCGEICAEYKYIALQGTWCSCDNTYDTPAPDYHQVLDDKCNTKTERSVGNPGFNAIYSNPSHIPRAPPPTGYRGCYKDVANDPDLKHGPQKYGYDPATCMFDCGQYKYVAMQDDGKCFCDNQYKTGDQYELADDSECNKGIVGNGGHLRNAIYDNGMYWPYGYGELAQVEDKEGYGEQ